MRGKRKPRRGGGLLMKQSTRGGGGQIIEHFIAQYNSIANAICQQTEDGHLMIVSYITTLCESNNR